MADIISIYESDTTDILQIAQTTDDIITIGIRELHPDALNWADRVVTNGGLYPSGSTIGALSNFCWGLEDNNLTSKMKVVNCFAPDNLVAVRTPLIRSGSVGTDPWGNASFVLADLSINGLKGTGAKYLTMGAMNFTTIFPDDYSAGITLYVHASGSNYYDCGYTDGAGDVHFTLTQNRNNTHQYLFGCWDYHDGEGGIWAPNTGSGGYLSGNRTAINTSSLYRGDSTTSHQLVERSYTTSSATRQSVTNFLWFGVWVVSGTPFGINASRLSFAAIHLGLSESESSTLYTLVQTMRQDLGGGYL